MKEFLVKLITLFKRILNFLVKKIDSLEKRIDKLEQDSQFVSKIEPITIEPNKLYKVKFFSEDILLEVRNTKIEIYLSLFPPKNHSNPMPEMTIEDKRHFNSGWYKFEGMANYIYVKCDNFTNESAINFVGLNLEKM